MTTICILGSLVMVIASAVCAANDVYLFASFRGNGEDGLHLAHSRDGLKWSALNGDKSFLKPQVGGKLMRTRDHLGSGRDSPATPIDRFRARPATQPPSI